MLLIAQKKIGKSKSNLHVQLYLEESFVNCREVWSGFLVSFCVHFVNNFKIAKRDFSVHGA